MLRDKYQKEAISNSFCISKNPEQGQCGSLLFVLHNPELCGLKVRSRDVGERDGMQGLFLCAVEQIVHRVCGSHVNGFEVHVRALVALH